MEYLIVSILLFVLNLVTECPNSSRSVFHVQCICSIPKFYVSTQLGQVLQLNPVRLVCRLK